MLFNVPTKLSSSTHLRWATWVLDTCWAVTTEFQTAGIKTNYTAGTADLC